MRVDVINPSDALCRYTARTLADRWGQACYMVAIAGDNPQLRQVAFVPFGVMLELLGSGGAEIGKTEPTRRTGPVAGLVAGPGPRALATELDDTTADVVVEGLQRDLAFQRRVEVRRHGALPPR